MNDATPKRSSAYGWVIVAYGILVMCTLHYTCFNSFALFMVPITEGLGVSRSTLSVVSSISSLVSMAVAPVAGRMLSRKSVKKLMFLGILVAGASILLQGFATSVWQLYVLAALRDGASEFALAMPFSLLMARWFDKNRGLATSLVFVGISMGGAVFSTPLTRLIEAQGWRTAYVVCGLIILLLVCPLCLLLVRDGPAGSPAAQPEQKTTEKDSAYMARVHHSKAFWLYVAGMFCCCMACGGALYHIPAYVQSLGYSAELAATLVTVYSLICIGAKIGAGLLFDHCGMRWGVLFVMGGAIGCFALMLAGAAGSLPLVAVGAALFGIGLVCQSMFAPSLICGIFGPEHYSEVCGEAAVFNLLAGVVSNPLLSGLYDLTGGYTLAWCVCLGFSVASMLLLLRAIAVRRPC